MILNVVGGNEEYYPLAIHTNVGAEVVVENEYETFTKIADDKGCAAFCLTEGIWTATSTKDGNSKTISIEISEDNLSANNGSFDMTVDLIPKFTYSGKYELVAENTKDWQLHLKTTGKLNFTELNNASDGVEVFLCGGGGAGGAGGSYGGGGGGGGGYTKTGDVTLIANNEYSITIGGSGGTTSAFNLSASAGKKGAIGDSSGTVEGGQAAGAGVGGAGTGKGGSGGMAYGTVPLQGGAGSAGVYAFGSSKYLKFGAGGGGGGAISTSGATSSGGSGGTSGGGSGGSGYYAGKAGKANTGGGGGGDGGGEYSAGGTGGSGIVIIRNKRS